MLVEINRSTKHYYIAVNNATGSAELQSDFSYLTDLEGGTVVFDLTHMGAPLTQERRAEYYPGGFGYQPTQLLLGVVTSMASAHDQFKGVHSLKAIVPGPESRVGRFLADMQLNQRLGDIGVIVSFAGPATTELGADDPTRQNLIPLTAMKVTAAGPDFKTVRELRDRIEGVFVQALHQKRPLANLFTQVVSEAVDNLVVYGHGGLIGGLYYPRVGEVEITLVNRRGGFGGVGSEEQLEALLKACEKSIRKQEGGGNGINELSALTASCFGTLVIRNGNAKLSLPPDGSVIGFTEETGFVVPGAAVTVLLQLIPSETLDRNDTMNAYEAALMSSLERYVNGRQQPITRDWEQIRRAR
jgi:hypothetical protein